MDLSGTFDTTNALSGLFLWVSFGFLAQLLNCDLQRLLRNSPIVLHLFGLLTFSFLFTLLDSKNTMNIGVIWAKTLLVYILFVLMVKSKWYFVMPVLLLLLADQSLKKDLQFVEQKYSDPTESQKQKIEARKKWQKLVTTIINYVVIGLIVIGNFHYMYLQWREYGPNFSLVQFYFGFGGCKGVTH